jgi:membrane protein
MRSFHFPKQATETISLLTQTFRKASEDRLLQLSAGLAYYSMFSIGPLLVMTFGLAGIAFGHDAVRHQIDAQLQALFGPETSKTLDSMMTSRHYGDSLLTTAAGIAALLFGATGVFSQLQSSMNVIWSVKPKPNLGIWGWARKRFLSLVMVLGTGFLLLISLVLTTLLTALAGHLEARTAAPGFFVHAGNIAVSFLLIAALFAMIFKFLPDALIPFSKVWGGAVGTALLFEAGKYLLSFYLGREGFTSSYGAAGAVIALLLWVYYGSLILFLGAEFTRVYVTRTTGPTKVSPHAVPVLPSKVGTSRRIHVDKVAS